jgi:outer membrane protein assembly factor BamA
MKTALIAFTILLALHGAAVIAAAQDLRAEAIAQQQARKAAAPPPYEPGKGQRLVKTLEDVLYSTPRGFYPVLDTVYSGGGITGGVGYRRYFGDATSLDVKGMYSLKNYRLFEVSTTNDALAGGRLSLSASTGLRDATQVGYYGLGAGTARGDRANFRFTQTWVGGQARFRPASRTVLGAGLAYEDFSLDGGQGRHPSIATRYSAATAPGLGTSPAYLHAMASAGIDTRPAAGYARTGGLYEAQYHNYHDTKGSLGFDRFDVEAVQHIPVLRENWVISLHGELQTTLNGDVPYFLLPSLGGGTSLRGYSSWRYRDRHSVLLQGELRWIPNRYGLDMALFYDAGTVAATRADLDSSRMKSDVGIGIRLHSLVATPVRIDLARGSEGMRLVMSGSAAF